MPTEAQYVERAQAALLSLVDDQGAVAEIEAVARLIESTTSGELPFEPHHLTQARKRLLSLGQLEVVHRETIAGRPVALLSPADTRGRSRFVLDAQKRKSALLSRYYGWTQGTAATGVGLTGAAGEAVADSSLRAANIGPVLAISVQGKPNLPEFLGRPVPGGPLDNGVVVTALDRNGRLRYPEPFYCPVEVKNIREWVYPQTAELYQLLNKAVHIQLNEPDVPIVPILICRRAHITTRYMAKQLGFFVADSKRHYFPVHSRVEEERLAELRRELGLADLTILEGPCPKLVPLLKVVQQTYELSGAAERWKATSFSDDLTDQIAILDDDGLSARRRSSAMYRLRQANSDLGNRGGW